MLVDAVFVDVVAESRVASDAAKSCSSKVTCSGRRMPALEVAAESMTSMHPAARSVSDKY